MMILVKCFLVSYSSVLYFSKFICVAMALQWQRNIIKHRCFRSIGTFDDNTAQAGDARRLRRH